jgi:3-deoxy-D-manno-octulosonic-acid transferase
MIHLYNTALAPLRPLAELWARRPWLASDKRVEWEQRRGLGLPCPPPGGLWIHGASVGEARIVRGLAGAIRIARHEIPLSVSALTSTGRTLLPAPPEVDAAFFSPLDFRGFTARAIRAIRPIVFALVETELWPNLLREALDRSARIVVVNGRLSDRRMGRYRRFSGLFRPLLAGVTRLGAQTELDAKRFVELGAVPTAVAVTGNVKYDLPAPAEETTEVRNRLGLAPARPVFVAGSTWRGEDDLVLDAFEEAKRVHPDLLLLLAPRHPERVDAVEEMARSRGHKIGRCSRDASRSAAFDVMLVDTVGELPSLYQLASVAFVGGTLAPVGGHNLLEPAAVGVPVLFGPHTDNVREIASALRRSGAATRVTDARELSQALRSLLHDMERRDTMGRLGRELVRSNRGALERSTRMILEVIDTGARVDGVPG